MHRIDADGYIEISGKRYFQDQDDGPPPIAGTIDHSLWNNALQEEIAQFLEALGVTLATDGAADAAAGWHQMRDKLVLAGGLILALASGNKTLFLFSIVGA
jgi:ABC-type Fe2+-enterobactin transport system substrate-binding protein